MEYQNFFHVKGMFVMFFSPYDKVLQIDQLSGLPVKSIHSCLSHLDYMQILIQLITRQIKTNGRTLLISIVKS